jgi:hypothetical protein
MGFRDMFDFLQTANLENGAPAGHHAIQFIRQWAAASFHAGTFVSFEDLPPQQRALAYGLSRKLKLVRDSPYARSPEIALITILGFCPRRSRLYRASNSPSIATWAEIC